MILPFPMYGFFQDLSILYSLIPTWWVRLLPIDYAFSNARGHQLYYLIIDKQMHWGDYSLWHPSNSKGTRPRWVLSGSEGDVRKKMVWIKWNCPKIINCGREKKIVWKNGIAKIHVFGIRWEKKWREKKTGIAKIMNCGWGKNGVKMELPKSWIVKKDDQIVWAKVIFITVHW